MKTKTVVMRNRGEFLDVIEVAETAEMFRRRNANKQIEIGYVTDYSPEKQHLIIKHNDFIKRAKEYYKQAKDILKDLNKQGCHS